MVAGRHWFNAHRKQYTVYSTVQFFPVHWALKSFDILLYRGSFFSADVKTLEAFHMKCQRQILRIR